MKYKRKILPLILDIHWLSGDYSIYNSEETHNEEELDDDFFNKLQIGKEIIINYQNYKVVDFEISLNDNRNMFRIFVEKI